MKDEATSRFPDRLEAQIASAAEATMVTVKLSFLIAMQRHILLLMNQLALAEEEATALRAERDEAK